jgi:hypothetical protein
MKSWTKPTDKQIDAMVAASLGVEQRHYFFSKLNNPLWVLPLAERGFFNNPPKVVPTGDGGVQIPFWPESQYLARIAREAPDDVVKVASAIRTDNPRVREDILDIALAVDDKNLSKRLATIILTYGDTEYSTWVYPKLGKLAVHWAEIGLKGEALAAIQTVIWITPDRQAQQKQAERAENPTAFVSPLNPGPRCDFYIFQTIIRENIPGVALKHPFEVSRILANTLSSAIELSLWAPELREHDDASDIWCPHLDHADDFDREAKPLLANALTNACGMALKQSPEISSELDNMLKTKKWRIFRRLRWQLYSQFPEINRQQIRDEALNYAHYGSREYDYEFMLMLRAAAEHRLLDNEKLTSIFCEIVAGPDIDEFTQHVRRWAQRDPTDEEVTSRRCYFHRKQLQPFKAVLPDFPETKRHFESLVAASGEVRDHQYLKFNARVESGEWREKSPLTVEELEAKSDEELITFLNTWTPSPERDTRETPSLSGLETTFRELLKKSPDRFLAVANRLRFSNPVYVRDFIYFLTERAKQDEALPWEHVLELLAWVLEQPIRTQDEDSSWEHRTVTRDFTECRKATASLLKAGMRKSKPCIPFCFRETVFVLLKRLCSERDPSLDRERANVTDHEDFLTEAINSIRGEALEALIAHAVWMRRALKSDGPFATDMPEVLSVIEDRLNPEIEQSLAVHAIFGLHAATLFHLDPAWFRTAKEQIFPFSSDRLRWSAAFRTFVFWAHPVFNLFPLLHEEYVRAVQEFANTDEGDTRRDINEALGEHLITLYWWGAIPLSPATSLLPQYVDRVTPKLRAHLMHYIGRVLHGSDSVPLEVNERLMAYWEYRLRAVIESDNVSASAEELSPFAWWFESGKLNNEWCFAQLGAFLKLVSRFDEAMYLLKRSAEIAADHPLQTIQILNELVKSAKSGRYLYLREEHVKIILLAALNAGIPDAKRLAEQTQDMLLKTGRFEYKDL